MSSTTAGTLGDRPASSSSIPPSNISPTNRPPSTSITVVDPPPPPGEQPLDRSDLTVSRQRSSSTIHILGHGRPIRRTGGTSTSTQHNVANPNTAEEDDGIQLERREDVIDREDADAEPDNDNTEAGGMAETTRTDPRLQRLGHRGSGPSNDPVDTRSHNSPSLPPLPTTAHLPLTSTTSARHGGQGSSDPLVRRQQSSLPPALALTRSMNGPPGSIPPLHLGHHPTRPSDLEWALPLDDHAAEKQIMRPKTVSERLEPTLAHAIRERDKAALRAKTTGWSLNIAIGLQVLLGTLTTGLSAATATARQIAITTTILGGMSTLVASFLAKMRGSNEPEFSVTRVKDLDHFIRECEAFKLDRGHNIGDQYDNDVQDFRNRLEEMLGNNTHSSSDSDHRPSSSAV